MADAAFGWDVQFVQPGPISNHRQSLPLEVFLKSSSALESLRLSHETRFEHWTLDNIGCKAEILEKVVQVVRTFHLLDAKRFRIYTACDELMTNVWSLPPRFPGHQIICAMEWNETEVWVHLNDPSSVFKREDICMTAGFQLVVDLTTDFMIRSLPNGGTRLAARIDLLLSNSESDAQAKRLVVDTNG